MQTYIVNTCCHHLFYLKPLPHEHQNKIWAVAWDFQQFDILTSVDSDEPVQPPFKLRTSKRCSVSSLTLIEYSSDEQRLWSDCAYAQADLSLCWSHIPHCWKSRVTAHIFDTCCQHLFYIKPLPHEHQNKCSVEKQGNFFWWFFKFYKRILTLIMVNIFMYNTPPQFPSC